MDFCSSFLSNGSFGCYPSKSEFQLLIDEGFNIFVDLTTLKERERMNYVYNYELNNDCFYINYSIIDNKAPICPIKFTEFLSRLQSLLSNHDNQVYIHCRGGHGRSTLVVASLLKQMNNLTTVDAMAVTKKYHKERKNLKEKYRNIQTPQVFCQRNFIFNLFKKKTLTQNAS